MRHHSTTIFTKFPRFVPLVFCILSLDKVYIPCDGHGPHRTRETVSKERNKVIFGEELRVTGFEKTRPQRQHTAHAPGGKRESIVEMDASKFKGAA